jgi:cytochrome P450
MSHLNTWIKSANPASNRHERRAVVSSQLDFYIPPLQLLFGFLRVFWPIPRLFGWAIVTRHSDVEEVLARPDVFKVPFGKEMARLNDGAVPGTPFILGIDDPQAHDAQLKLVMAAFPRQDVANRITIPARDDATNIVAAAASTHRINAIQALVIQIPINICVHYYGVAVPDPARFSAAARGVSGHLFGLPPIVPKTAIDRDAAYLRSVVDAAIANAIANPSGNSTVAERLAARITNGEMSPAQVRAFLMGMIVGFVPTNTIAGGHILDMLLSRPSFRAAARSAAEAGDDDLLAHCLFEALRFNPINFGPFRVCAQDHIIAAGTRRSKRIKAGTKVLASTMSAMFDRDVVERPFHFVPGRPASGLMNFGFGMHWCVGACIAQAQLTQTMKALLLRPNFDRLRGPAGRLKRVGGFPTSMVVKI